MRDPNNPFILSGYHSPAYFCNRDKELAWLLDQFQNERNAVIYAYRRIGKTLLIQHFFYHLEKQKKNHAVFVDLLGTSNLREANQRIAEAIISKFGNLKQGIGKNMLSLLGAIGAKVSIDPLTGLPEISFGLTKGISIDQSMEALGNYLKGQKKQIVIAIDEFQQITNYSNENAEAVFRSWTQQFPMIRFVFSGSHRNMMQSMFADQNRPFYGSAQLMSIDPLESKVYKKFIQSFFAKQGTKVPDEVLQDIFSWCRMQTYYVQLFCNKLYARQEASQGAVNEIKQEILQQEVYVFSNYHQLFTKFQWQLLKAIAQEEAIESPNSKAFVSKHGLGAASSVSTALKTLVKKEFVVLDEARYRIHDTLFMRWLQQL